MESKRKIDTSHEKTTVIKGATIVNYLHRDFQLLWLIRTMFTDQPNYSRITNFRMDHTTFFKSPSSDMTVLNKCRGWMLPTTSIEVGSSTALESKLTQ